MIGPFALLVLLHPASAAADERLSSYDMMSPEIQAIQDDTFSNPGLLWVVEGGVLWEAPEGTAGAACVDCHGDVSESMTGVAARYPAWDEGIGGPVDLAGRVNLCRLRHQGVDPLARDDRALLALTSFLARQSDGLPITPDPDTRLNVWRERGQAIFRTRMGQLNLSCANCHDDHAGGHLAAATIPQAHPTGYPQYRLLWEEMGSLHRRFDNCMNGIRSEPFPAGSPEYVALELFLMERAAGLPLEAPAVRP